MNPQLLLIGLIFLLVSSCKPGKKEAGEIVSRDVKTNHSRELIFETQDARFVLDTIVTGIPIPYGMDWLPDGTAIVTERAKRDSSMGLLNTQTGQLTRLGNVPTVFDTLANGMMDVLVHPDYKKNGWLYYSYTTGSISSSTLVVERAKIINNRLEEIQRLFTVLPYYNEANHYGTRMLLRDGYLFITMGERFDLRDSAQSLSNHLGKIIRIREDGSVPTDNPFAKTKNALPEIWSYGHRNPQGLAFHPVTGELWESEHGPKGGDEINIVRKGLNYGWPIIGYGIGYDNKMIGDGISHKEGMEQPLYYYRPSIAPSGMEFYTGNALTKWKGNLFIGSLVLAHLNRLTVEGNSVIHEERIFEKEKWRIRFIKTGPDGLLYFGVDGGKIMRIRPV
jgi:aldose sugar dehydrogenase